MATTALRPIHLLDLCDQKLMDFVCNMDNKDLVWLREIQEEAERMFTREFSKEPELMPKTPSQKNRRRKRRVSYVQDENRDPIRKRSSRRKIRSSRRSSRLSSQPLRGKDRVEKLTEALGQQGSPVLRRVTRAAAAAAATTSKTSAAPLPARGSPIDCSRKLVVEINCGERNCAEQQLIQTMATSVPSQTLSPDPAPDPTAAVQGVPALVEESVPKKPDAVRSESAAASTLVTTPQGPSSQGTGPVRSACKLKIARGSRGPQDSPGTPDSPWREQVLVPIQPENCSTTAGCRPVRCSLIAPDPKDTPAEKYSLVVKQEGTSHRSNERITKKVAAEPAASGRIICHSYLERLLNVEVPQRVGPKQKELSREVEPLAAVAEPEVPESSEDTLLPHSATETAIHMPDTQPAPGGQEMPPKGQQGSVADEAKGYQEPPQSVRRKRSYKQAMSEQDEEPSLVDEELQLPRNRTPSPPCPASKVVRPLRTFLHTVQRNQLLMTPSTTSHSAVMKSFIKRNTPLRVDPKSSFVEKERQRLENLRRKEEAEQLRKQKVEEEKRRRREEEKLKREERHRKVLQARERVEQMKEEKKKQMEQKLAQLEEKTEKAKEERQAEEKAKKKAMAKKMEEVEARRRQEEEARRLRWLQQEEEERRHQELLQRKKEEEQERLRKVAEARRLAEQREQERRREQERLQAERELQEREKALRLQWELEEKKKKEEEQRLAEQRLQEEQEKAAKEAATASKALNVTVDIQSPACTSYQMTPQGNRRPPKIHVDSYCNYGMDLNSDDSTDDEAHPRKPIPVWARGVQLSQAIVHQYYHPPNLAELFGTILPLDLEDIFKKSKPRYHKRTSSAVWNSPPLQGTRAPGSLALGLRKY
ncbi:inner centromere protein isoform X2 [Cavia porcellus]|uniref:Inner centromere protein n=1 Tax=Cavia porcellus TaxID=10141 RepID=A0A286XT90_CAVPO|nr:inner centromere protein isoform X1 [Cavia porcellus]